MLLIFVSLAPVIALILFIYFRDKYEKEPFKALLGAFVLGMVIVIPVVIIELLLSNYFEKKYALPSTNMGSAAYNAFIVAAFTEEVFKMLPFLLFFWRNKNFNEKFDGIVYATLISLGFAAVENVLYVFQHGMPTGILRAFTAVPAHAIFGITMGFFLGAAKFNKVKSGILIAAALIIPIILHGVYDFILMSQNQILLLLFIPYMIFMIIFAWKRMKSHTANSEFKLEPSSGDNITINNQL